MIGIEDLHKSLKAAVKLSQINAALKDFLLMQGIESFVMTCYYKSVRVNNSVVEYSFMSPRYKVWNDHYHQERYDEIDSTSQQAKQSGIPVFWDIHQQIRDAKTQREKQMRLDSLDFGADCGLTIPVHHASGCKSILMVGQMQGQSCLQHWETKQYRLHAAAHYYDHYLRIQLLKESVFSESQSLLTARQIQCLRLLADGVSMDDIAKTLNVTIRTINYHIQNINKCLNTKNKYLSVSKARSLRLIE